MEVPKLVDDVKVGEPGICGDTWKAVREAV